MVNRATLTRYCLLQTGAGPWSSSQGTCIQCTQLTKPNTKRSQETVVSHFVSCSIGLIEHSQVSEFTKTQTSNLLIIFLIRVYTSHRCYLDNMSYDLQYHEECSTHAQKLTVSQLSRTHHLAVVYVNQQT